MVRLKVDFQAAKIEATMLLNYVQLSHLIVFLSDASPATLQWSNTVVQRGTTEECDLGGRKGNSETILKLGVDLFHK